MLLLSQVPFPFSEGLIQDFQVETLHAFLEVEGFFELARAEIVFALYFFMFFLDLREFWFFLWLLLVILGDEALDLLQDFLFVEGLTLLLLLNDVDDLVKLGDFLLLVADFVAELMLDD